MILFRETYKKANDQIKIDEKLLDKTIEYAFSGKRKTFNYKAVYSVAAAFILVVGVSVAYPKLIESPVIETVQPIKTSEAEEDNTLSVVTTLETDAPIETQEVVTESPTEQGIATEKVATESPTEQAVVTAMPTQNAEIAIVDAEETEDMPVADIPEYAEEEPVQNGGGRMMQNMGAFISISNDEFIEYLGYDFISELNLLSSFQNTTGEMQTVMESDENFTDQYGYFTFSNGENIIEFYATKTMYNDVLSMEQSEIYNKIEIKDRVISYTEMEDVLTFYFTSNEVGFNVISYGLTKDDILPIIELII